MFAKLFNRVSKSLGFRFRRRVDGLRRAFPSGSAAEISAVEQFSPMGDGEYELYQQYYENCLREVVRFKKTAASDEFAQHITHVGQYLFRFRCGRVLKVAIDTHDHREVRSREIHNWSDLYFKSNRWPDFDYSPKVRPIPIGNSGITLENCRSLRSLRTQPKIFDFIFVGRIWAGGGANVEHNLQLFENLAKLGRNSKLLAVVFNFDQKSPQFQNIIARLKAVGVEWTDRQIGYSELMEWSAQSRLVVLRAGVSGCIAWRMVDMLGLGACIVMDQAPFPHWPVPLQEGRNFLSLGLRITPDCGPAPLEDYEKIVGKMEIFLNEPTILQKIGENNARYFDEYAHPFRVAQYVLEKVKENR
jgi:hypothetical protein